MADNLLEKVQGDAIPSNRVEVADRFEVEEVGKVIRVQRGPPMLIKDEEYDPSLE
ncbi:MAG: hypothetical protein O7F12_03605 [Nitrospirae bacterium]|nr:hypothetical protein [Nitrospirota bacterium]